MADRPATTDFSGALAALKEGRAVKQVHWITGHLRRIDDLENLLGKLSAEDIRDDGWFRGETWMIVTDG